MSEQIAREGLVHASLNHVWESTRVSLREQIELTNQALAGLDMQSPYTDVQKMRNHTEISTIDANITGITRC